MKSITIDEKNGGYVVRMEGFIKVKGEYVYKSTEVIQMVEFVGAHISDNKVHVEIK